MSHYNNDKDPNVKMWEQEERDKTNSLFDQIANISKAHGYDILSKHVGELKDAGRELREALTSVIAELKCYTWSKETQPVYDKADEILKKTQTLFL